VLHGDNYLEKRGISVDTTLSESGTLCVLQADKEYFTKNRSE